MSRSIRVDPNELENAVVFFSRANRNIEELHYRLNQLGNEIISDKDLAASPEYEVIIQSYMEATGAVDKIHEFFESTILTMSQLPEMYAEAERKNANRIKALTQRSVKYQKALTDTQALQALLVKLEDNEDEEQENISSHDLEQMVNAEYNALKQSLEGTAGVEPESLEGEQPGAKGIEQRVHQSFVSNRISVEQTMEKSEKEPFGES